MEDQLRPKPKAYGRLVTERRRHEGLLIGCVHVHLPRIQRTKVQIVIDAPPCLLVMRDEVAKREGIRASNAMRTMGPWYVERFVSSCSVWTRETIGSNYAHRESSDALKAIAEALDRDSFHRIVNCITGDVFGKPLMPLEARKLCQDS